MSVGCLCSHCDAADCNRRKNDKIRCTKYSQWVNPNDIGCDAYVGAMSFADMSPEKNERNRKTVSRFNYVK